MPGRETAWRPHPQSRRWSRIWESLGLMPDRELTFVLADGATVTLQPMRMAQA